MKFNIFWLAPFVLPFVLFWFIAFFAWATVGSIEDDTRDFTGFAALVFGVVFGAIGANDAMKANIGWLSFPSKKGGASDDQNHS